MSKKKFSEFMSGKGYYIALILGAIAIGITGYWYYANQNDTQASTEDPAARVAATTPGTTVPTTEGQTQPSEEKPTPTMPQKRIKPVDGQLLSGYAADVLSYNPTTRDWRTHKGIDIAAEAGTAVCAAADGTVYAVYEDETMGMTVVIHHDGGYTTTYSALAEEIPVKAGEQVYAGQNIGKVGNTALLEAAVGDHLHFAVSCGEEAVDPAQFLE